MPSDWKEIRLGDVIKVEHGWPFKSEHFSTELTGKPIVVSIGNFVYTGGFRFDSSEVNEYRDSFPERFLLQGGDVLLVMTCQTDGGEILGIPARIPDDGRRYLHNQRMGRVVLKEPDQVSRDFLYYVFLWREFNEELVASSSGTKIKHTAPSRIEAFKFQLPPLNEQKAIADALSALDRKIELNRRMNRTLRHMVATLFKSWFVDFDPVVAKAAGRTPYGMDDATTALFPDGFEESELGPIPRGWKVESLDRTAEFLNGLAMQKFPARSGEESLPVIKIAELRAGSSTGADRASRDVPKEYVVDTGDLLFSWSGSLVVDIWTGGKGALNQHLFKVTSEKWPKWFVYRWLLEHLPDFQGTAADKATTMGHIRRHHLSEAKVILPTSELIDEASRICGPWLEKRIANSLEIESFATLHDELLPELLSGEIRLSDAEKQVSKVL